MAFSINQVKHLYVAKAVKDSVANLTQVGDIFPRGVADKSLSIQYKSPGSILANHVDLKTVTHAVATSSDAMAYKLKRYKVSLDEGVSNALIPGQEYILRLAFRQYIGLSDADQNFKFGTVIANKTMKTPEFYAKMALSVAGNLDAKDSSTPIINIFLTDGTVDTPITKRTKLETLVGEYTGIIFEENVQDWVLGLMPQGVVPFTPQFLTIKVDGMDQLWGKSEVVSPVNKVPNGRLMADFEYFHVGARGDIYRNMGFPNVIHTTYLVDPSKVYDTLDIQFAFVGSGVEVQRSEQSMVILAENDGEHTVMNQIIAAVNTASGLKIKPLA